MTHRVVKGSENPLDFAANYFEKVLLGQHIRHQNYAYISATPLNRRSFIRWSTQAFRGFEEVDGMLVTTHDMDAMYKSLCGDFPLSLIEDASSFMKPSEDKDDPCLVSSAEGPIQASPAAEDAKQHIQFDGEDAKPRPKYLFKELMHIINFIYLYSEAWSFLKLLYAERKRVAVNEIIEGIHEHGELLMGSKMPDTECLEEMKEPTLTEVVKELYSHVQSDIQFDPWGFPSGSLLDPDCGNSYQEFDYNVQKQLSEREAMLDVIKEDNPPTAADARATEKKKKKKK